MSKRFQRRVENFTCLQCGAAATGNGYTNHCPRCLWSRHVDIDPGDRAAACQGAMRRAAVETSREGWTLTHVCEACGATRRCKSAAGDDRDAILAVAREAALSRLR